MTYADYRALFREKIKGIYEAQEFLSVFSILTAYFFNQRVIDITVNPNAKIENLKARKIEKAIDQLALNTPIQYVTGRTEFCGLELEVNPNVLIPRPETEEMVFKIVRDLRDSQEGIIADICSGSGCIAIALSKLLNKKNDPIDSFEISTGAISLARANAKKHNTKIRFFHTDILKLIKLPAVYDLIVSNPPYIRKIEKIQISPNVLNFEPHLALFVNDNDPLIFYRKIMELGQNHLSKQGFIYFEISQYLASETSALAKALGYSAEVFNDFKNNPRILKLSKLTDDS